MTRAAHLLSGQLLPTWFQVYTPFTFTVFNGRRYLGPQGAENAMHSHLHGHPALQFAITTLERLSPDQFELYFERRRSTKIDSKEGQIDSLSRSEDVGLAVRLIKDRRLGFSFTTSLEKEAIEKAMRTAFEVAALMPEDPFVGLAQFGEAVYPNVDTYDSKGLAAPVSQKAELAKELEALCRRADPRIKGVRSASVGETMMEVHMVDSGGEHLSHLTTLYSASITARAEQDGESQMGGDFGFSNHLDALDIQSVGKQAAAYATELLGAGQAPTLLCPAILRNSVVAELLEFLSSSFSAEQIDKGRSMLAGRQGSRAFSEHITIVDDGLLPGGYSTSPFDAEGTPSTKTILVDGGLVAGALYDGYYARKLNKDPTGSSVRGLKSPPSIGFSNLYIQPGRRGPEQLLEQSFKGIPQGILITDLMGVHTANPVTGDFSLGASGILIEGGKLTRPVRGFAVAGNVLELFRKMTDISSDLRFFGNVGAPSVRVAELSVGGS
jgi:PmbA protein